MHQVDLLTKLMDHINPATAAYLLNNVIVCKHKRIMFFGVSCTTACPSAHIVCVSVLAGGLLLSLRG